MGKRLKFLIILAMVALLPVRAVAAVTIGFCALADKAAAVQLHAEHGHASSDHSATTSQPQNDSKADCNVCAEHCTSASFAVPASPASLPISAGLDRAPPGEMLPPGFIPEQLDRPPVVL
jgi:hypothetical protein